MNKLKGSSNLCPQRSGRMQAFYPMKTRGSGEIVAGEEEVDGAPAENFSNALFVAFVLPLLLPYSNPHILRIHVTLSTVLLLVNGEKCKVCFRLESLSPLLEFANHFCAVDSSMTLSPLALQIAELLWQLFWSRWESASSTRRTRSDF